MTDPFLDPPGSDLHLYSEKCLHLPETLWCYDALDSTLDVGPLPALSTQRLTFGCQNSYRKLHPGVLALWARVLKSVPNSQLFLYADEHARDELRKVLVSCGVTSNRIDFGGRVSRIDYLKRYDRIDIGLDTFPFNGATTTLDAAWMGVPVVTLSGAASLQRAGTSIAMNLGLPELVAGSDEAFVERAVALAGDLNRLSELRGVLRARLAASPLGTLSAYARHVEAAYRSVWRRYCQPNRSPTEQGLSRS
jgi:predicted O-linked N-acetylglucosamine transferase (SPINDLY family)